jgi:hypothetical protein
MDPLAGSTVADLWAHARALGEQALRESDLPSLRRALVTLAVAGSGDDEATFTAEAQALSRTARRLGLDPEPLFDAAAALVAEPDLAARRALVLAARREPLRDPLGPPGSGTPWGILPRKDG